MGPEKTEEKDLMCAILTARNLLQEEIFSAEAHSLKELVEAAVKAGSDLTLANLAGANLVGVDLSDADLSGANLLGANLNGANLNGTNLEGVKR